MASPQADPVAAAEENPEADRAGQTLGPDRGPRRTHDSQCGDGSEPQNEHWIEDEVENHGSGHDDHRRLHVSDPTQERLKDEIHEDRD